jgi:hypothetical protein
MQISGAGFNPYSSMKKIHKASVSQAAAQLQQTSSIMDPDGDGDTGKGKDIDLDRGRNIDIRA